MEEVIHKNLVLGTGPLGFWVMKLLVGKGERVTFASRSGKISHKLPEQVNIVAVDLKDAEAFHEISKDAEKVFHCAMPPYTDWPENFPPMTKGILDGLKGCNAKLIFKSFIPNISPFE